jgi:methionyl-tRNA formyltransferase
MDKVKIIFMGTPTFSVPVLEGLIEKYNVIAVVTQPDKKVGRNQEIAYSPVKKVAVEKNIKIFQPNNIINEYQQILNLHPGLIITCAYGQILPEKVLNFPEYKCINVHASLLPKLRGGAPIHRALMQGHYKTGITLIQMTKKMDAGPIISQREIEILDSDNVGTLHNKLSIIAKELLIDTMPDIINNEITLTKQNEREATFAWNIKKEEEIINWDKSKSQIFNYVRGLNPWPAAYTRLGKKIIKILEVGIGYNVYFDKVNGEVVNIYDDGIGVRVHDGEIIIKKLKPEGKNVMSARDYINGLSNKEEVIGRLFY